MTALAKPRFILTGWHFLAMITGFFAIVVGVDIYFAVLAYRTFPGESAANPYEAGLAFERTLDDRAREAALGWRAEAVQGVDGGVTLTIEDKTGAPIPGLAVAGSLRRPATEQGRKDVVFAATTPGQYQLAPAVRGGAWDMALVARDQEGHAFEISRRLVWP